MEADKTIDTARSFGGNVVTAALVLARGYVVAAVARRLSHRLLEQPAVARALGPSLVRLVGTVVFYILFAIALGLALIAIGVPERYVGTVAVLVIALLALSLQQSLANLAATVTTLLFQPHPAWRARGDDGVHGDRAGDPALQHRDPAARPRQRASIRIRSHQIAPTAY